MPAEKGNTYAQKGQYKASSHLHIRVSREEKGQWVAAAYPHKLSEWVIKQLNAAAREDASGS